jgi:hypothetical protein
MAESSIGMTVLEQLADEPHGCSMSAFGTERTSLFALSISAFEGKADIAAMAP